jgi:hypothetical protein
MKYRFLSILLVLSLFSSESFTSAQGRKTPTQVVQEFYKHLRERRFREAFSLSIYRPAIEGLSNSAMEELRPDFEKIAVAVPEKLELSGEQISAGIATVFMKPANEEKPDLEVVTLILDGDNWIVGDKENQQLVKKAGKNFFFQARIDAHHQEVENMLRKILGAQIIYGAKNNGAFADLQTLIKEALVPKDLEGSATTGYRFSITVAPDRRSFSAKAEPAVYGRTGKLSFHVDQTGAISSKDVGGKPYAPTAKR